MGQGNAGTVAERADLVETLDGGQDGREVAGPGDPSEEADGAPATRSGAQSAPPRTLKDAAEALGIDAAELYKLELTTGDGETVTLGSLKDAWGERQTAVRETAQRTAELRERELAIATDRTLLTELAHELRGQVRPEVLQRLAIRDAERRELAERLLVQHVPEFRDPDRWRRFGRDLLEQMAPFGIGEADLAGVRHPGFFRVAKDWMEARAELKRLLSYQPEKDPPKTRTGSGRGETGGRGARAAVERARTGSEADKVLGVEALIGEAVRR